MDIKRHDRHSLCSGILEQIFLITIKPTESSRLSNMSGVVLPQVVQPIVNLPGAAMPPFPKPTPRSIPSVQAHLNPRNIATDAFHTIDDVVDEVIGPLKPFHDPEPAPDVKPPGINGNGGKASGNGGNKATNAAEDEKSSEYTQSVDDGASALATAIDALASASILSKASKAADKISSMVDQYNSCTDSVHATAIATTTKPDAMSVSEPTGASIDPVCSVYLQLSGGVSSRRVSSRQQVIAVFMMMLVLWAGPFANV